MKKILFAVMAVFALASCQETVPTVSPKEATMHVGDTLQLTVTGEINPQWHTTFYGDKEIAKVIENNQVVALEVGSTEVWFEYRNDKANVMETVGCKLTIIE